MSRNLWTLLTVGVVVTAAMAGITSAKEPKSAKHVWIPPVEVTQALNIKMETKATEALLKRATEQCVDADCKKQVDACRKVLSTCVIVPSKESVREQELENN